MRFGVLKFLRLPFLPTRRRHERMPSSESSSSDPSPSPSPPPSAFRYDQSKGCHILEDDWSWSDDHIPLAPEGYLYLQEGARVGYFPNFFDDAKELYATLESEMPWIKRAVLIDGKSWMQPRMICYMADASHLTYTYFDTTNSPEPYTPSVERIKSKLETFLKQKFNCCLSNFYKTGGDYMEFHADNEPLFGTNPTIASVSFGQERAFDVRNIANSKIRLRYMLGNGDLFIMEGGEMQKFWHHAVIADDKIEGGRINMTFRLITNPESVDEEAKENLKEGMEAKVNG